MTKLFREEYNCETGELKQIPLTEEEIAIWESELVKMQQLQQQENDAKVAKNQVLTKLGITQEEAALLLS